MMNADATKMFHELIASRAEIMEFRGKYNTSMENVSKLLEQKDNMLHWERLNSELALEELRAKKDAEIQRLRAENGQAEWLLGEQDANLMRYMKAERAHDNFIKHLRAEKDAEIQRLLAEKDAEIQRLLAEKDAETQRLLAEKDEEIRLLRAEKNKKIRRVRAEKNAEIRLLCEEINDLRITYCPYIHEYWPGKKLRLEDGGIYDGDNLVGFVDEDTGTVEKME